MVIRKPAFKWNQYTSTKHRIFKINKQKNQNEQFHRVTVTVCHKYLEKTLETRFHYF